MKKQLLIIFMFVTSFLLTPSMAMAQDPLFEQVCQGRGGGSSVCTDKGTTNNPFTGPTGVITRAVQIVVIVTTIAAVIMLMVGGFKYIVSVGDSNGVNAAKNTILYAVIGLAISVIGQAIVLFVLQKL